MKILLFNRPSKAWIGGDSIQSIETGKALQRKKVWITYADRQDYPLGESDITHIFSMNFNWTHQILRRCVYEQRKYIISAIFYPTVYDTSFEEMREFVNRSLATIALSEKEKAEMVFFLKCDPQKIVVIPNGIDPKIFYKDETPIEDYVVSIGRIQKTKGIQYLVEACKRAGKKLRYISSECNGAEAKAIRTLIDDYHQNIPQENVANLLRRSRIYVCPSLTERQSLGVLEAAACGLPIVDSFYHRGNLLLPSSLIVNPTEIDKLVKAIHTKWGAPRNTDNVPTWDDIADMLISLYKQYA